MSVNIKTSLICYDDHRGFTEDIRKQFIDTERYIVNSYPSREEFVKQLHAMRGDHKCKIAILGVHDTKDHFELIDKLTIEIKRIDARTGLILICPPDKMDDIRKSVKFNIDAFIPKNSNTILRVDNIVKKLISEYNIGIFRKRRNFSFFMFLAFMLLSLFLVVIAFFRYPQYF
jgi:hypothetical protein